MSQLRNQLHAPRPVGRHWSAQLRFVVGGGAKHQGGARHRSPPVIPPSKKAVRRPAPAFGLTSILRSQDIERLRGFAYSGLGTSRHPPARCAIPQTLWRADGKRNRVVAEWTQFETRRFSRGKQMDHSKCRGSPIKLTEPVRSPARHSHRLAGAGRSDRALDIQLSRSTGAGGQDRTCRHKHQR
jgi:hypothetical protein